MWLSEHKQVGLRKEPAAFMQGDLCFWFVFIQEWDFEEVGRRKSLSELAFSLSTKQKKKKKNRVAVVVVGYQFSRKAT